MILLKGPEYGLRPDFDGYRFKYLVTRLYALSLVFLVGILVSQAVSAQEVGRIEQVEANTPPFFYFLQPGEATTQVYIWGSVLNPGLYEVGTSIGLEQLLTLAGGPLLAPREHNVRQEITVRVYREGPEGRAQIFEALIDELVQAPTRVPVLQDSDVVTVETVTFRPSFTWRDALSIATGLAAVALAVDRLLLD